MVVCNTVSTANTMQYSIVLAAPRVLEEKIKRIENMEQIREVDRKTNRHRRERKRTEVSLTV